MDHHYPNTPNHAGHAHTYSGPPPSLMGLSGLGASGMEHDPRAGPLAYRSGTLGRPHQAPPPPPPTDIINGAMPLPPVDYRYCRRILLSDVPGTLALVSGHKNQQTSLKNWHQVSALFSFGFYLFVKKQMKKLVKAYLSFWAHAFTYQVILIFKGDCLLYLCACD